MRGKIKRLKKYINGICVAFDLYQYHNEGKMKLEDKDYIRIKQSIIDCCNKVIDIMENE